MRAAMCRPLRWCLLALTLAGCGGGVAIPTPPPPTAVPGAAFQRGMAYVSYQRGEFGGDGSNTVLAEQIAPLGVNWLAVVVTCYQESATATTIDCGSGATPSDDDVTQVIHAAHALGMKVLLKPHVNIRDSATWRGEIAPANDESAWRAWFASYTALITHYAAIAQQTGAEYFAVGTELAGTSQRAADWRAVVRQVRAAYRGPLTYAANHSGEETAIQWWDALDAIGVDAYYPLGTDDDPGIAQLTAAWQPAVARLGDLSRQWNRPVMLTEVGYQSARGANRTPWGITGTPADAQVQADCYQSVFNAFADKPWLLGIYWWAATPLPAQGGPTDTDFTPLNKPAAAVLRANYSGAQPHPVTPSP